MVVQTPPDDYSIRQWEFQPPSFHARHAPRSHGATGGVSCLQFDRLNLGHEPDAVVCQEFSYDAENGISGAADVQLAAGGMPPRFARRLVDGQLRRRNHAALQVETDNLQSHKVAGVRQAIAATEASAVFLPPYGPGFNPIEQVFVKVTAKLRKKAERTVDRLPSLLGHAIDDFSAEECVHYFRHCAYSATSV